MVPPSMTVSENPRSLSSLERSSARRTLRTLRTFGGSVVVLTVLCLFALDLLMAQIKPLSYFDVTEFVPLEQNPMVANLKGFLDNKGANPAILILGSSQMLFPAVRCDEDVQHKRHRYDSWFIRHCINGSLDPIYFGQVLRSKKGTPVSVVNLAVQGSIVSDQLLLLQRAIERGKTPQVVFLELAPRALLDNMHKRTTATPIHQVLADFSAVPELFKNGAINKEAVTQAPGYFWYFYKVKADYRTLIVNLTAALLNRPLNNWEVSQGIRHKVSDNLINPEMAWQVDYQPPQKYHDLAMYDAIYNPPDPAFWQKEENDLRSLLALASRHGIRIIIVDMPETAKNLALLSPVYNAKYRALIDSLEKQNLPVMRLHQSGLFNEADFEDSAHLNADGGRKLFNVMAEKAAGYLN